jgi:hypothetical protein
MNMLISASTSFRHRYTRLGHDSLRTLDMGFVHALASIHILSVHLGLDNGHEFRSRKHVQGFLIVDQTGQINTKLPYNIKSYRRSLSSIAKQDSELLWRYLVEQEPENLSRSGSRSGGSGYGGSGYVVNSVVSILDNTYEILQKTLNLVLGFYIFFSRIKILCYKN